MLRDEVDEFRRLHAAAGPRHQLDAGQDARYSALAERLARCVLAAQNGARAAGQRTRQAIRAQRALRVDVTWSGVVHRTLTVDVGAAGFGALLPTAPATGAAVFAQLHLSGSESLVVVACVAGVRARRGSARVSFEITEIADAARVRLGRFVLDHSLGDIAYSAVG